MNEINLNPELDLDVLKEQVQASAMKGAISAIDNYYNRHNSPFKEQLTKYLDNQKIGFGFDIPDIIAVINGRLSAEVDRIANEAIAHSFIPVLQRFLVREDSQMDFSTILKKFLDSTKGSYDDYWIDFDKDERFNWITITLNCSTYGEYKLTLHQTWESKKDEVKKYNILSLPRFDGVGHLNERQTMVLSADGVSLGIPFSKDILHDEFTSFLARLIIAKTEITIDCHEFYEEWFQNECHC